MPFQPGNQEARKGHQARPWKDAINRAIKRREADDPQALEKLADRLLKKVGDGDIAAIKELGDRLDGKAEQPITGPEGGPIEAKVTLSFD